MPSVTNSRKLRIPVGLGPRYLWMLKTEAGYKLVSETNKFMEFERPKDFVRGKAAAELTEEQKDALAKRCDRIADIYLDPIAFRDEIIDRIRNITRTMNSLESDFCWGWVERNLDYE